MPSTDRNRSDGGAYVSPDGDGGGGVFKPPKGPCIEMLDQDGDDIVDAFRNYEYDAAARPIAERYDEGPDGTLDGLLTYRYDAIGRLVQRDTDDGADGIVEIRESYQYNAEGKLIAGAQDGYADGRIEVSFQVTNGPYGPTQTTWTDTENDELLALEVTTYDDQGRSTRIDRDNDGDRYPDLRVDMTYDENGNLVKEVTDQTPFGSADLQANHEYNEERRRVKTTYDDGVDGQIESTTLIFYECFSRGN